MKFDSCVHMTNADKILFLQKVEGILEMINLSKQFEYIEMSKALKDSKDSEVEWKLLDEKNW